MRFKAAKRCWDGIALQCVLGWGNVAMGMEREAACRNRTG